MFTQADNAQNMCPRPKQVCENGNNRSNRSKNEAKRITVSLRCQYFRFPMVRPDNVYPTRRCRKYVSTDEASLWNRRITQKISRKIKLQSRIETQNSSARYRQFRILSQAMFTQPGNRGNLCPRLKKVRATHTVDGECLLKSGVKLMNRSPC